MRRKRGGKRRRRRRRRGSRRRRRGSRRVVRVEVPSFTHLSVEPSFTFILVFL